MTWGVIVSRGPSVNKDLGRHQVSHSLQCCLERPIGGLDCVYSACVQEPMHPSGCCGERGTNSSKKHVMIMQRAARINDVGVLMHDVEILVMGTCIFCPSFGLGN